MFNKKNDDDDNDDNGHVQSDFAPISVEQQLQLTFFNILVSCGQEATFSFEGMADASFSTPLGLVPFLSFAFIPRDAYA